MRRRHLLAAPALLTAAPALAQGAPPRARTLVIAQTFDPVTLWPNATTASDNINAGGAIVESLFRVDPAGGRVEPLLATEMTQEGPESWIVKLRPGVRFTNGEPMDAAAVVQSVTTFADARLAPAYASYATAIAGAEQVDDLTVRVRTKYPTPTMALILTQVFVTPTAYWREKGPSGFGQQPVGTGPFRLTEWVKDSRLVMDRNEGYWGPRPDGFDRLIWRPIPDETARAAALETGEVDVALQLPVPQAERLAGRRDLRIVETPSYRIYHLTMSSLAQHPSPLHDRRVRQALNHAVDKGAIVDALFSGRARVLNGQLLRPQQPGYDPALRDYAFDPARARALLREAGHPNGFEITFKIPSGRYPQDKEVSEAVAGMLAEVGVRARIQVLEAGEFLRQLRERELAPLTFLGLAPADDPDFQVGQYRSDWRYSYVQSPEFDRLIDAGRREMDPERRATIYRDLMRAMHAEAPVVWLYQGLDLTGTAARVSGLVPRGDGRVFVTGVRLAAR